MDRRPEVPEKPSHLLDPRNSVQMKRKKDFEIEELPEIYQKDV